MTIEQVWLTLQFFAEKYSNDKKLTVRQFNNLAVAASNEKLRDESASAELNGGVSDSLIPFIKKASLVTSSGTQDLPDDFLRPLGVMYGNIKVDRLTYNEYVERVDDELTKPTLENPVYCLSSEGIAVYPNDIDYISMNYIGIPEEDEQPRISFLLIDGAPLFGRAASVDFIWSEEHHLDLIRRMLQMIDISANPQQINEIAKRSK